MSNNVFFETLKPVVSPVEDTKLFIGLCNEDLVLCVVSKPPTQLQVERCESFYAKLSIHPSVLGLKLLHSEYTSDFSSRKIQATNSQQIVPPFMALYEIPDGGFLGDYLVDFSAHELNWPFCVRLLRDVALLLKDCHEADVTCIGIRPDAMGLCHPESNWVTKLYGFYNSRQVTDIYCSDQKHILQSILSGFKSSSYLWFFEYVDIAISSTDGNEFAFAAFDIFCFGIVMLEALTRKRFTRDALDSVDNFDDDDDDVVFNCLSPCIASDAPQSFISLTRQCLSLSNENSSDDVHSWLDSIYSDIQDEEQVPANFSIFPAKSVSPKTSPVGHTVVGAFSFDVTSSSSVRLEKMASADEKQQQQLQTPPPSPSPISALPESSSSSPPRRAPMVSGRWNKVKEILPPPLDISQQPQQKPSSSVTPTAPQYKTTSSSNSRIIGYPMEETNKRGYVSKKAFEVFSAKKWFILDGIRLSWCGLESEVLEPQKLSHLDLTGSKVEKAGTNQLKILKNDTTVMRLTFRDDRQCDEWYMSFQKCLSCMRCRVCNKPIDPHSLNQQANDAIRYSRRVEFSVRVYCSEVCANYDVAQPTPVKSVKFVTAGGDDTKSDATTAGVVRLTSRLPSSIQPLEDWLRSLNLDNFVPVFISCGYTSLRQIQMVGLTEDDMDYLGISTSIHKKKLIEESIALRREYHVCRFRCLSTRPILSPDGKAAREDEYYNNNPHSILGILPKKKPLLQQQSSSSLELDENFMSLLSSYLCVRNFDEFSKVCKNEHKSLLASGSEQKMVNTSGVETTKANRSSLPLSEAKDVEEEIVKNRKAMPSLPPPPSNA